MATPPLLVQPRAAARPHSGGPRWRWALLLALAFGSGLLVAGNPFRPSSDNPAGTARAYLRFKEILSYVDRDYVDSADTEGLTDYAVARMLEKLDPHSVYLSASERERSDAFLQGSFDGVGLDFYTFRDTTTVSSTLRGGPAEEAGLRPGDHLLRVGTKTVAGTHFSSSQLAQLLRGARGSTVALLVARPGQPQPLTFTLTRRRLPNPSVEPGVLLADGQTGYVKINRFAADTYDEFRAELESLRRRGLTRLVLDLRGNPGGYLDRATRLADEFIAGSRKLVYTDGKGEQYDTQTYAHVAGDWEDGPLAVLVDENSASAAEVLAGALQDHDRALLIGRRTFGKGLVQRPITLQDGGELRLTIARYYTPAGRCIQKPYGADAAAYNHELAERQQRGEYASADSVPVAKELRFRTDHGRAVYGGGGIVPDVFVARDSVLHSAYFSQLCRKGVLRAYAQSFYQRHRAELASLRAEQFRATFQVSDADLEGVGRLARLAGVAPGSAALRRCAPLARLYVKAYIAQSLYGLEISHAVLREEDAELQQALQSVKDGPALLALLHQS
ncbi:MAG: S41 family peptidase [Hymenobacter sp.]|nr:MAG: S41 family peptidase [Hymenobacter sp.]